MAILWSSIPYQCWKNFTSSLANTQISWLDKKGTQNHFKVGILHIYSSPVKCLSPRALVRDNTSPWLQVSFVISRPVTVCDLICQNWNKRFILLKLSLQSCRLIIRSVSLTAFYFGIVVRHTKFKASEQKTFWSVVLNVDMKVSATWK